MKKYKLYGNAIVNFGVEVEAKTKKEAVAKLKAMSAKELAELGEAFILAIIDLSTESTRK